MSTLNRAWIIGAALLAAGQIGCEEPVEETPTPSTPTATPAAPSPTPQADSDSDGSFADADCDDGDSSVYPGAPELCDGLDNDCDSQVDEEPSEGSAYFPDLDGDGDGDADASASFFCQDPGEGYSASQADCDDSNAAINASATELCDGIDNDCDALIDGQDDDVPVREVYWQDTDGDGWGDEDGASSTTCEPGFAYWTQDCDDTNPGVHPSACEAWGDGLDQNCNGQDEAVEVIVRPGAINPEQGANVFGTLSEAINAAFSGQRIGVEPGYYQERIHLRGKNVHLVSQCGPDETIVDAAYSGSTVLIDNGENSSAGIEGFTLQGGTGTDGSICGFSPGFTYGGGICIAGASPTIVGNWIIYNTVGGSGAGVYVQDSTATFKDNFIWWNEANYDGGGFNISDSGGRFETNDVAYNYAGRSGGGMVVNSTTTVFQANWLYGNYAEGDTLPGVDVGVIAGGGAILSEDDNSRWYNNLIAANEADGHGGAFYVALSDEGGVEMVNNDVVGNTTLTGQAGGIFIFSGAMELMNNIVSFNQGSAGSNLTVLDGGTCEASYNLFYNPGATAAVTGITLGETNLVVDPMYKDDPSDLDVDDDNYYLKEGSPAIDAGNPDAAFNDVDGTRNDLGWSGGPGAAVWED